jgi:hypothetical protein
MKTFSRLAFAATLLLPCIAAFGEEKLLFENDTAHLVYYDSTMGTLAGQPVTALNMPSGNFLLADLYLGTSSGSLSLAITTSFSTRPGEWTPTSVITPLPINTLAYVVVQVRDVAFAPPSTWTPGTSGFGLGVGPFGYSQEFTVLLGGGITFPSIVGPGSTWPPGNYPMPGYGLGAIPVGYIPEPSTAAFAGLGLLIAVGFLRRNQERIRERGAGFQRLPGTYRSDEESFGYRRLP